MNTIHIPHRGYLSIAPCFTSDDIPRRGFLSIAPCFTSDDIPRRGFLSIAPCLTTDKDAPKGHNLNNTVQAAGAVRCLYDETECVPKGRDIKNIFLSIAPCPTTDKDAPKGHDLNNTVQTFFVQCRDRREQHCKNAQCGARHLPSSSVPKGRDIKTIAPD